MKFAIVGNIAAGKSTVEKYLSELGYTVYDTDKIAHSILDKSQAVIKTFGEEILTDDKIDRKKLAKIVFTDKSKLNQLESVIHPEVKKELLNIFNKHSGDIFVSVPQLFEAKMENLFDKIIFVTAPEAIRLKRLMTRNNLSKEEAMIRIAAQESDDTKIKKSDFVINNSTNTEDLKKQIVTILDNLK